MVRLVLRHPTLVERWRRAALDHMPREVKREEVLAETMVLED